MLSIAILAGGESRRMGRDKAEIVVEGEALLARTVRLAQEVCPSVMVVGRTRPDDWPGSEIPFYADADAGKGPVGGLATALSHAGGDAIMLVACDLPWLTTDALRWLLQAARYCSPLAHGLVTMNNSQREPTFSVYTVACIPLIEATWEEGRRSLMAVIRAGQFARVDAPPEISSALFDADTPEDLDALG